MTVLLALALTLVAALLLLVLTFIKRKSPAVFREIAALTRLKRAAGLAVEDGTRLHVSLGRGGLVTPRGAASLSALALLRQIGEQTSISDRPPVATSGDPVLAALSQDTLQAAYQSAGVEEFFEPASGRLGGMTPFSYAASAMMVTRQEQVSTDVLMGDFGPEIGLLTEASERENANLIAAAHDPAAQSILFASTNEPLVGEELFAIPAYIGHDPAQRASLQVQDVLRWLLILALLVAAGLKMMGVP
ncbi:MAG: hypothetical protein C4583_07700 [Anaerolineaceae bacterium]|nr:MAG: hypothetical protein C4583_07700 [Anaerolineaceae bacterium]